MTLIIFVGSRLISAINIFLNQFCVRGVGAGVRGYMRCVFMYTHKELEIVVKTGN